MNLIYDIENSEMIRALRGEVVDPLPCWMMRQAGRYLPEYRATRAQAGSFLDLCFNPALATEVTLQPLRRFDLQAAILFSDILVIPWALGQHLEFQEGEGPVLEPIVDGAGLAALNDHAFLNRLEPVLEAVSSIRQSLDPKIPLIGFVGAPWTLATYAIAGRGTKDQAPAKQMLVQDPETFDAMIALFENACFELLDAQIKAGANIVKLFDSWAGSLSPTMLERACIGPLKRIVARLKQAHPSVPVIVFPRAIAVSTPRFLAEVQPDALAVDQHMPLEWIFAHAPEGLTIQGNLDPLYLTGPWEPLQAELEKIKAAAKGRPFIFNLGHGITPDARIENVERMIEFVRRT